MYVRSRHGSKICHNLTPEVPFDMEKYEMVKLVHFEVDEHM